MRALGCLAKGLLALAALPIVLSLLLFIPLGAFALLSFLLGEVRAMSFVPAIALYLFGFCLPVGLYQWSRRGSGHPSGAFRLPGIVWLAGGAAAAIVLGQILLVGGPGWAFSLAFLLAAALPPVAALGLAAQRLGPITTWRRVLAGLLSGSLLSTHLTILLAVGVSFLAYMLVAPLREVAARVVASPSLEQLFYSPALVFALAELALVAPVVEELTKPLAALFLARRLRGPSEAFLVGMAGGVGFAVLENMLYESAGARVWASVAALRGVGGALHPLNAGLVAVGWYGVRNGLPGAWPRLLALYGLAVGLHALWNGSLVILYSGLGAYFFGTDSWEFDLYGVGQPGIVVTFMLLQAVLLWRLLFVATARLRGPDRLEAEPLLELHLERPRRLALWAMAAVTLVVPAAALYGPLVERYGRIALPFR